MACRHGDYDGMVALLNNVANLNATDAKNKTALDIPGYHKGVMDEQRARVIQVLLERDVRATENLEKTFADA